MTTPSSEKLAAPVDLSDASPDRQAMYGGLSDARARGLQDQSIAPPETPVFERIDLEPAEFVITEDDKRAFLRAVLGDKSFEKTYILFGQIEVLMVDRSVDETEKIYESLRDIEDVDQWRLALEQAQLASTLSKYAAKSLPPAPDLKTRIEELMKHSKPVYKALLETSRKFEKLVATMTEAAHLENFWPAGGAASQSAPTQQVRSTTGAPAVRTGR